MSLANSSSHFLSTFITFNYEVTIWQILNQLDYTSWPQ